MQTFIHQIWQGEVTPGSRPTPNSPEISKLLSLRERHKNTLLSRMTEEQADLFAKYREAVHEADRLITEDAFAEGIRYAVRLLTEAMQ